MRRRRRLVAVAATALVVVIALVWGVIAAFGAAGGTTADEAPDASATAEPAESEETAVPTSEPIPEPTVTPAPPAPAPAPGAQSIDIASSLWVVTNKLRPLNPKEYAPVDLVEVAVPYVYRPLLRAEAAAAAANLFAAFTAETGLKLQSQSAYRSYTTQISTYNGWVGSLGQAGADRTSARPGHSEHQTGLSIDISSLPAQCALQACFGQTPHGQWLAANAWRFGFHLRYPQGKTHITGYEYEPWHFRYVGAELATRLHLEGDPTLEEHFGLPPAPDYAG